MPLKLVTNDFRPWSNVTHLLFRGERFAVHDIVLEQMDNLPARGGGTSEYYINFDNIHCAVGYVLVQFLYTDRCEIPIELETTGKRDRELD